MESRWYSRGTVSTSDDSTTHSSGNYIPGEGEKRRKTAGHSYGRRDPDVRWKMTPTNQRLDTTGWESMFAASGDRPRRRPSVDLIDHDPQDDPVIPSEAAHSGEGITRFSRPRCSTSICRSSKHSGYIERDQESHEAVKGPTFDEIRPLLELIHDHRDEHPDGWI